MPIARPVLERQLALAKAARDAAAAKVTDGNLRACPGWRNADANYRQMVRRLKAVGVTENLDAELRTRKTAGDGEGESAE